MRAARSSISSSELAPPARLRWGVSLRTALWVLVWLALIDIAVNLTLGTDTVTEDTPSLKRYFEYGRSIEGKLARMVAADPRNGGEMLSTGWIDDDWLRTLPAQREGDDDVMLAVYGQSFSHIASREAAQLDGRITVRGVGGPGAPASHSYAAYKADVKYRQADVVVFGILSWAVPTMGSMSGLISNFESPAPYSYPRYRVVDGKLQETVPVIGTEAQFRAAFTAQGDSWQRYKEQLRAHDRGYRAAVFDASWADHSAIARLLRRGWVSHARFYEDGVFEPGKGFNPESDEIRALQAIAVDMSKRTRDRGERLIVLLLHSQGHADYLYRVMAPTLEAHGIEFISTHALFSSNDASNYLFDGHYTAAANGRLARALQTAIRHAPPAAR